MAVFRKTIILEMTSCSLLVHVETLSSCCCQSPPTPAAAEVLSPPVLMKPLHFRFTLFKHSLFLSLF